MDASLAFGRARAERSFDVLYREHVSRVYRYALAVTGNTADAEDVTQTTFMNAFRAYAGGQRPMKPENWLLKIAHNVCLQRLRTASRRPTEVALAEEAVEVLVPPDGLPTVADLRRALALLPYLQRATLVMRELEGRSHREIAESLGLTIHATEMLAFRARKALREHLEGTITCSQAEATINRDPGQPLDRTEAGALRAHLRECPECARAARRSRAQRSAWSALSVAPLPASLQSFSGGGAAAAVAGLGGGLLFKAAAVTVAGAVLGGGTFALRHTLEGRRGVRQELQPRASAIAAPARAPAHGAASMTSPSTTVPRARMHPAPASRAAPEGAPPGAPAGAAPGPAPSIPAARRGVRAEASPAPAAASSSRLRGAVRRRRAHGRALPHTPRAVSRSTGRGRRRQGVPARTGSSRAHARK